MVAMADTRLFTVEQVAERLHVSHRTVHNWLRAGVLKGYRLGGRRAGWRIEEPALEEFIAARKAQSAGVPDERE